MGSVFWCLGVFWVFRGRARSRLEDLRCNLLFPPIKTQIVCDRVRWFVANVINQRQRVSLPLEATQLCRTSKL